MPFDYPPRLNGVLPRTSGKGHSANFALTESSEVPSLLVGKTAPQIHSEFIGPHLN